jgi:hypothetical protein
MERRDRSPSPRRKNSPDKYSPEQMEVEEKRPKRKRSRERKRSKEYVEKEMEVEYLPEEMIEENPVEFEKQVKKFGKLVEKQKNWKYFETPDIRKITPPLEEISVLENRIYFKPEATSTLVRTLLYHALEKGRSDVCVLKNFTHEKAFRRVTLLKKLFEYFHEKGNPIDIFGNWNVLSLNLSGSLKQEFENQRSDLDPFIKKEEYKSDTFYDLLKKNKIAEFIFLLIEMVFEMGAPRYKNKKFIISSTLFEECLNNKKIRFIIIPLCFDSHMNVIIVDKRYMTAERFEPFGEIVYTKDIGLDLDQKEIDKSIEAFFTPYHLKYYAPEHFCPAKGIQYKMEKGKDKTAQKYGTTGFCVTWSYLFALMRLTHPEVSNDKIASSLMEKIEDLAEKSYIQKNLGKMLSKNEYLKKDFILEFVYEYLSSLFSNVSKEIDEINAIFPQLNLKLKDRVLIF